MAAPGASLVGQLNLVRSLRKEPAVVRICRARQLGRRALCERLEREGDGALDLRVVPLPHERRVLFDLDVRGDAVVLDLPLTVGAVESPARGGDDAAVDEPRVAS